ncbi:SMI1/KNR4 family protein [Mucilaginibacter pedocola]|uniref:Knr4/Smi1-like domain-containing protein n=1 Tax=Mucilaginibacter pedocola TaxID=1792845 RepID=A0A1S9PJ71_9SPHI|nr:hypothetical protein [Mucilaginibacter pedocola]OOQ61002.1 hypothetical protein BC343_21355 [Mucilaginibacter pedocola]
MEIKYLTRLKENAVVTWPTTGGKFSISPISMEEIIELEAIYNGGKPFPTVLRELLYIAGEHCHVLDYGIYGSQAAMQEKARGWLVRGRRNLSIPRPFFVIDVYNAGNQFLFVYLDESQTDPIVYEIILDPNPFEDRPGLHSLEYTLSTFIDDSLGVFLSGYNPF